MVYEMEEPDAKDPNYDDVAQVRNGQGHVSSADCLCSLMWPFQRCHCATLMVTRKEGIIC